MDKDGYPTIKELKLIRDWEPKDFPALLDFIEPRWAYQGYKREVITDFQNKPVLVWTLTTAGWSGNESIINALLENRMFSMMWYYQWTRGGKFIFRIDPVNAGYILVSDYCKKYGCSRQNIHKQKDKFKTFTMTPNKVFILPLNVRPKRQLKKQ